MMQDLLLALSGDYYVACNEVFRRSTNQTGKMLEAVRSHSHGKISMRILSVGSGAGLFEVPMLESLVANGVSIREFVGIDVNTHACKVLEKKLQDRFSSHFDFGVINQGFQEFFPATRFDMILYNHSLEYFGGHHPGWIHKSLDLLSARGNILIFSPNRGGINKIYAEIIRPVYGIVPFFSDDIERILTDNSIALSTMSIQADCDIRLIQEPHDHIDKIKLLSFLTHLDCREMTAAELSAYSDYFLSLRPDGKDSIPHPATLFII